MEPAPKVPTRTWPKMPPRLQIPTQNFPGFGNYVGQRPPSTAGSIHTNPLYVPYFNNMQPMTPTNAMPQNNPYYNPFMHPGKASDFMFKQFEGFKDFTMNTAKSGLSVGEKSAFWMYNKVSTWSKKWFTHIFLFLIILIYTGAGAAMFVAVEGTQENILKTNTKEAKQEFIKEFRQIMRHNITLIEDPEQWEGEMMNWMMRFESQMEKWIEENSLEEKRVWTFWNAVFYCGTIYTTIGES